MAKELAAKAKEAFVDDDFDVAVDLYSKAIDLDPKCAEFFADRAQANIKLENFTGNFLRSVINEILLKGNIKSSSFVFVDAFWVLGFHFLYIYCWKELALSGSVSLGFSFAW